MTRKGWIKSWPNDGYRPIASLDESMRNERGLNWRKRVAHLSHDFEAIYVSDRGFRGLRAEHRRID